MPIEKIAVLSWEQILSISPHYNWCICAPIFIGRSTHRKTATAFNMPVEKTATRQILLGNRFYLIFSSL